MPQGFNLVNAFDVYGVSDSKSTYSLNSENRILCNMNFLQSIISQLLKDIYLVPTKFTSIKYDPSLQGAYLRVINKLENKRYYLIRSMKEVSTCWEHILASKLKLNPRVKKGFPEEITLELTPVAKKRKKSPSKQKGQHVQSYGAEKPHDAFKKFELYSERYGILLKDFKTKDWYGQIYLLENFLL